MPDQPGNPPDEPDGLLPPNLLPTMQLWRSMTLDVPLLVAGEVSQFTMRRLQAQADHWAKVGHCQSLEDLVELTAAFSQAAVNDYADEATTLVKEIRATVPVTLD